jgi:hypothetical protein
LIFTGDALVPISDVPDEGVDPRYE